MQERFIPRKLKSEKVETKSEIDEVTDKVRGKADSVMLTPVIIEGNDYNIVAIRRRKVRELRDLGYSYKEITLILRRGIVVGGILRNFPGINNKKVLDDLDYLNSEDIAADKQLPEKRAEMLSKYNLIYREVLRIALAKSSRNRASFFNIAKGVLDKVTELEGINSATSFDPATNKLQRAGKLAEEINEVITDKEKDAINTTISEILKNSNEGGTKGFSV